MEVKANYMGYVKYTQVGTLQIRVANSELVQGQISNHKHDFLPVPRK